MSKVARISWIDIAKYICIMCVILIHMESCTEVLRSFFRPFYLALFFFLSGYVHKQIEFKSFVKKKISQLMIPWFIFSMLNIILTFIMNGRTEDYAQKHGSLIEVIGWNFLQVRGFDDGMWFVAALFVAYFPFYFLIGNYLKDDNKERARQNIIILSSVLCIISLLYSALMPVDIFPWPSNALPWHLEYIFQAMFFMVLGYLFRECYESKLDLSNTVSNRIIVTIVYIFIAYIPMFIDINSMLPISMLYFFVSKLMAIVVIISWCKVIKPNAYLLFIGRNTLIVFGIHNYVFRIIEKILASKLPSFYSGVLGNVVYSTVFALFFAVVVSVILIIPTYIIEKYFPWMIGKKATK